MFKFTKQLKAQTRLHLLHFHFVRFFFFNARKNKNESEMSKIFTAWRHKYVCTLLGNPFLEIIFSSQQIHLKRSKTKKLLRPRLCNLPEVLNTGRAGLCTQDNQTHAEMSRKLLSVWIFFLPSTKGRNCDKILLGMPWQSSTFWHEQDTHPPSSPSTRFNQLKHKPHSALRDFLFLFFFPPNKTNLQTASLAFHKPVFDCFKT